MKFDEYTKEGFENYIVFADYNVETVMKLLDYLDRSWPDEPIETAIWMNLDAKVSAANPELILSVEDTIDAKMQRIIERNVKVINTRVEGKKNFIIVDDV